MHLLSMLVPFDLQGLYNSKLAPLLEPATFVEDPEEGEPPQVTFERTD